jgi:predicted nucleotidyltransferase
MNLDKSIVLLKIGALAKEIDPTSDVILYGSRARGEEYPDSDWDILILVDSIADLDYERIFRHKLYDLELELGEAFSVTVHNKNDWKSRYWMTPLYKNITREGIRI